MKTFYGEMTFDMNHCFLCAIELNNENRTEEHIFPKWLQKKHNLWDQTLTLLNDTTIPYRQLKVPCCKECNNTKLSNVENEVREAFEKGIDFIREMDKTILYKWIIKILYSLLHKQLFLKKNLKDKESNSIVTPEILKQYILVFEHLQSVMKNIDLDEKFASIFIFELHKDMKNNLNEEFFYVDDILHTQFAILSNGIGIICSLGDTQAIKHRLEKYFEPFYNIKLSIIQFNQLIADVFYNRTLLLNGSSGIFTESEIISIPPFSHVYKDYSQKEYALTLFYLLRRFNFKLEDLYIEEYDAVMNFLLDEERRTIIFNEDGSYSKGEIHTGYVGELFENRTVRINVEG